MKYYLLFLSTCYSLLISTSAYTQLDNVGQYNERLAQNWNGAYARIGQFKVRGTALFLGSDFAGSIKYENEDAEKTGNIAYDLYNQVAGFSVNGQISSGNNKIERFTAVVPLEFGGGTLVFKSSSLFGDNKLNGYVNVLAEGDNLSFLKLFKVNLVPDPHNTMDKEYRLFEQGADYYLYDNTAKKLKKIKLREKDIYGMVKSKEVAKKFVENNKLDLSKESDVIRLVNELNRGVN